MDPDPVEMTRPGDVFTRPPVDVSPGGHDELLRWARQQRRRGRILAAMAVAAVASVPAVVHLPYGLIFAPWIGTVLYSLPASVIHLLRARHAERTLRALPALPAASLER